MSELTDTHREVLAAVCDTVVPAIARDPDPDCFFARKASDVWVPQVVEHVLAGMPDDQRAGLLALLEALGDQDFVRCPLRLREQIMREVALKGQAAAAGIGAFTTLTLFLFYGLPDKRGRIRAGGRSAIRARSVRRRRLERPLRPYMPDGDTTLEADVCIVGSGAGGGVMAGVLSERGLKAVVLEAGGYFDDADFNQLEIPTYQHLYWRAGPRPTAEMNVTLQAGFCLGGGTVANWTNSLRTTPWVREQWEREFGLEGLASADFDRHLDTVWERLSINDRLFAAQRRPAADEGGRREAGLELHARAAQHGRAAVLV